MNFFEHQDQARHNTTKLLALFALTVVVIILALYLVALITLVEHTPGGLGLWRPGLFILVTIATLGLMTVGSSTKLAQLNQGGHSLAKELGGRPLSPLAADPAEERLINVVSEMALASGVPIPAIYVMDDESGINAFAAGYSPDDAVIGVTRGCLDQLTRDELQGVIGHEFSHILHGDMRLNLKLIGVLHGLLLIYVAGRLLLRMGYGSGVSASSRSNDKGRMGTMALAIGMMGIGYLGVLGGRLIKSAISREREFLADASAVQFTRNPDGIAGALRKIGQLSAGSTLVSPNAEIASHLLFGEANRGLGLLGGWFATHPPLKERIRRIGGAPLPVESDPARQAQGPPLTIASAANLIHGQVQGSSKDVTVTGLQDIVVAGLQGMNSPSQSRSTTTSTATPSETPSQPGATDFLNSLGTPDARRLIQVRSQLSQLHPDIKAALFDPTAATELVFALLVRTKSPIQAKQVQMLAITYGPDCKQRVGQYYKHLKNLDQGQELTLIEAVIPALKQLDPAASQQFFQTTKALSQPDGRLMLRGFALQLILRKRLKDDAANDKSRSTFHKMDDLWLDAVNVLALLARVGHTRRDDALFAFKLGLSHLPGATHQASPNQLPKLNTTEINISLGRLEQAVPKLKQAIVDACAHTVLADNDVTPAETNLLRAVVITLDCPAPPFLT
ncbi:M48 family metallopeptidase [Nodosilinea sp. P-1105]|uniref:M48 family metallopeptidase n=1 Tax=Nodosilinea sp. P-1105 TaxID=2546229 RepID=UPI001469B81A|nr:M48 family metallopeptidase [Nodosilinea sp. P-1105]NMF86164.1 hypothetical protein [Nodosilinea sp. P-1105]